MPGTIYDKKKGIITWDTFFVFLIISAWIFVFGYFYTHLSTSIRRFYLLARFFNIILLFFYVFLQSCPLALSFLCCLSLYYFSLSHSISLSLQPIQSLFLLPSPPWSRFLPSVVSLFFPSLFLSPFPRRSPTSRLSTSSKADLVSSSFPLSSLSSSLPSLLCSFSAFFLFLFASLNFCCFVRLHESLIISISSLFRFYWSLVIACRCQSHRS